jgi:probable HAF family extracellular repeat protein
LNPTYRKGENKMSLSLKISWLAAMIVAPFAVAAPVTTAPVDLGTLGGSTSAANAINPTKLVLVGDSNISGDANAHAFRKILGGALQDLGTLPLDPTTPTGNSSAAAVSLIGIVAGTSDFDITDSTGTVNRYQHPFYYTNSMKDMGTLGGSNAFANGIKDFAAVGSSFIAGDGATHAFYYKFTAAAMSDLGTLAGGLNSYAFAINLNGIVAGASDSSDGTTHAVTWAGTTITDLGTLGGSYAQANAINDLDVAVGYGYTLGDNVAHAWIGNMQDIGTLSATVGGITYQGSFAQANAINDYGIVVGSSNTPDDSAVHAFLYTAKSGMFDLNYILPAGSPWVLQSANGISLDGTVVGVGTINGEVHAFSWALGQ